MSDMDAGTAALQEEMVARIGSVIDGKYRLDALIGFGGTGAVYSARHVNVGRNYAVKMLHHKYTREKELLERFRREAFVSALIMRDGELHPNVVETVDAGGLSNGSVYIVQPLLKGETLEQRLDRQAGTALSVYDAVSIIRPVISAVAAAHRVGIIHRDLKPGNIFLAQQSGEVVPKVLDFGIAKFGGARITIGESVVGTPLYMSPEAFTLPRSVDARSDVWALGLIAYEMLTGGIPFTLPDSAAGNWLSVGAVIIHQEVPRIERADIPQALVALLMRCLSKNRDQRPADARVLADALRVAVPPSEAS